MTSHPFPNPDFTHVPPDAESILWRRIDQPGYEAGWLWRDPAPTRDDAATHRDDDPADRDDRAAGGWRLAGTAVFLDPSAGPCALSYAVACDACWHTIRATVRGRRGRGGGEPIAWTFDADPDRRRWTIDGCPAPAVDGAIDLDLNFTPATNTLSLRRLNLPVGASAEVTAAWLDFPSPALSPLKQLYRRTGERTYHYEAPSHGLATTLEVNADGFVVAYPPLWLPPESVG